MKIIEVLYNTRFHPDYGFQSMGYRVGYRYASPLPFGDNERQCIMIKEKTEPNCIWVTFSDGTFDEIRNHELLTYTDEQTFTRILPPAEYQPGEEDNKQPKPSTGKDAV